ncbi:MAG: AI-2E family transporter [Alsobacter sp.]
MRVSRSMVFWLVVCALSLTALVVLRPILFPFASGFALAYLLAPAVGRLEHAGLSRSVAALLLVLILVLVLGSILVVLLPALVEEIRFFIDDFPRTLARVQSLLSDSSRPWLGDVIGVEGRVEENAMKEVSAMGGEWVDELFRSAWTGGEALWPAAGSVDTQLS